jgi:UDP-N-acetylglucosamine--N-acetylmuramyl-(pentapeptide) pyrophosphoryl-undecaprenol N-acetylglucosamine transferase
MAGAGAAEVIEDSSLSAELLLDRVGGLLSDEARLAEMSTASKALARPDAARAIANEVLAAASGAPYGPIGEKRRTRT